MATPEQKAFDICLEMLDQRVCSVEEEDRENLRIIATKPDGDQLCVLFNSTPKFDTKSMKEVITFMNEANMKHAIIVYTEGVTPATKSTLAQTDEMYLELFDRQDLQYNITKHRLQPVFTRLYDKEAESFKQTYGTKFGTLRHEKPIARFYDYRKGDVIRVTREDGYVNYRIVR
jgi:DNA-directed RNA polymerase subunit H (RpoH/RPB5)